MLEETRGDDGLGAGAVEAGEMGDGLELRGFAAVEPGEGRGHASCLSLRGGVRGRTTVTAVYFIKGEDKKVDQSR